MELIEFYNSNQARVVAEKSEIEDYLKNMFEVQQVIIDRYNGKANKPFNDYLLKRDVELPDGVTLTNAWCYNMRVLDDGNYELDLQFDVITKNA